MTNAILGTFADAKSIKTRGVYQLLIEIPIENADHALRVLGGIPQPAEERWVGVAPVAAPKKPADETTTAERVKGTDDWSDAKRRMVQQSGIVRKEPAFHDFIACGWSSMWNHQKLAGKTDEEKAAYFLHIHCDVESCRDLEPAAPSGQRFRDLMWQYGQAEDQQRQREAGP